MNANNHIPELFEAGPDCLSEQELASMDSAGAAERECFERHLAGCSRCAAERELLKRFEAAAESPEERRPLAAMMAELDRRRAAQWPAAPARKKPFWAGWFSGAPLNTWALVAASLLVIVGGSLYVSDLRSPGLPQPGAVETLRSARLAAIGPMGELARPPERFEWKPLSGAERYRVTVRDVAASILWTGESDTSLLGFPAELRARLLPGKTLIWQVEALAGGKKLASSDPVRFVLRLQP